MTVIPNVVIAVGTARATAKQAAATDTATVAEPRFLARPASQADTQIAPRMKPGSTRGTSSRLAQGWSGTVSGTQSRRNVAGTRISSGSAHTRARPLSSVQVSSARPQRRTSRARPKPPSSTAGIPMYQVTQYRLSSA